MLSLEGGRGINSAILIQFEADELRMVMKVLTFLSREVRGVRQK